MEINLTPEEKLDRLLYWMKNIEIPRLINEATYSLNLMNIYKETGYLISYNSPKIPFECYYRLDPLACVQPLDAPL